MTRARLGRLLRLLVVVAVLVLAARELAAQWSRVGDALSRLSVLAVLGSLAAGCAAVGCAVPAWRALLAEVEPDHRLPWAAATRVFLLGQLGKFVPGSVWVVVAQTELGRRHGVPRRATATAGLLAMGVSLASALLTAAVFLPFGSADLRRGYSWLAVVAVVVLVGLTPPVLTRVVALGLRLLRREPLTRPLSWGGVSRAVGWSVAGWLLYGVHTYALARGLGAGGAGLLPRSIGAFAAAWAVGFLVVVAPAGLGPREAALNAAFGAVLAAPLALAVVSRLLLTVADLLGAGVAALLARADRSGGASAAAERDRAEPAPA